MHYLGGDNQTMAEIAERVHRCLRPLPAVDVGWPWQCFCGATVLARYRGRHYCWRCGRLIREDARLKGQSIRQAYDAKRPDRKP